MKKKSAISQRSINIAGSYKSFQSIHEEKYSANDSPIEMSAEEKTNKYLGLYYVYLKILLGRDVQLEDEMILSENWSTFNQHKEESILPQAVISFPNPDHQSHSNIPIIKPLQAVEFLTKVMKGKSDMDKLLLIKAAERIYLSLDEDRRGKESVRQSSRQESLLNGDDLNFSPQILSNQSKHSLNTSFNGIKSGRNSKLTYRNDQLEELYQQFVSQFTKATKMKILEKLNIDFSSLQKLKPKRMSGGRFYELQGKTWNRSQRDTQDYLTLIRNLIMIRLASQGFHTNSFFSKDGKYIFCLIYVDEENLKTIAQLNKVKKEINFSFCDLLSFEPVDRGFRPLRLNNRIWKPQDFSLSPMFEYLRPMMVELIRSINFKRVAREVNQSGFNQAMFQYGKVDFNDDDFEMSDAEWCAFYQYLVHMEKYVIQYREELKIDSDISALMNEQIEPFTLYMNRNKHREELAHVNKGNLTEKENMKFLIEFEQMQQRVALLKNTYKDLTTLLNIPLVKQIKIIKREDLALKYMQLFKDSLNIANAQQKYLLTMWDRLETSPLEPFITYSKPDGGPMNLRTKQISIWRKYQLTEDNKISLFSFSEQLKLVNQSLNDNFLFNDLITKKLVSQVFCLHDHYELFGHCLDFDKIMRSDNNFYRKKIFHLAADWKFNIKAPWGIPCDLITEYYGQKIGLYFYYLSYFTQLLCPIAIFGLTCSILQWLIYDNNDPRYSLITILFACIQIQWTNSFDEIWEQKQILFNLRQGQNGKEQQSTARSKFEGQCVRSIGDDQLNSAQQELGAFIRRCLFSGFILTLITFIYAGLMSGLFFIFLDFQAKYAEKLKNVKVLSLSVTVTATINIILIHIFEIFYDRICTSLTDNENHQSVQSYENSFVLKKYLLEFVSYIGPLSFIAYVSSPSSIYCYENNCPLHVQYHFSTMIIWLFTFRTLKYIKFIYNLLKIPIFKYELSQEKIKLYVQEQSKRQQFAISQERYGTLEDYMEIFIYNTLLSMFGYSFPISFFLVFVQSLAQLFADRTKFLYLLQRPWPQNENSLGIWRIILRLVSYLCLLNNTGSATIVYQKQFNGNQIFVFVGLLILMSSIKFFLGGVFSNTPDIIEQTIRRQKYVIKSTYEQFKKSTSASANSKAQTLKRYPIFKVYRTYLEHELDIGKYESISSQSDLDDHYKLGQNSSDDEQAREQKQKEKEEKLEKKEKEKKEKEKKNQQKRIEDVDTRMNSRVRVKDQSSQFQNSLNNSQDTGKKVVSKRNLMDKDPKLELDPQGLDEMPYEFFQQHFFKRCSDWAFRFQVMSPNPKLKIKVKRKHMKTLYHLEILSSYKIVWTELRFTQRNFFLKRKHQLIRNLDYRKLILLRENQIKMKEMYTDKAEFKFRKRIIKLQDSQREDDIQEHRNLVNKYKKYIQKHQWVQSRKIVVLKVKGIWFSGFRKEVKKQPAIKTVKEFYKRTLLIEQIRNDSTVYTEFDKHVDYKNIHMYDLDKFLELFSAIEMPIKETIALPLTTRPINPLIFYSSKLRSIEYKTIGETFRDTFIFDIQDRKLQEIGMQYLQEEMFPIRKYKLVRYHHNQTWVAYDEKKKQVLVQFIQIKYDENLVEFKSQPNELGVNFANSFQFYRQASIVDMVDDFTNKGYCLNVYNIKATYTLAQILKYRNFYSIPYSVQSLASFLYANLKILKDKPHGDISIDNYFLHYEDYYLIYPRNKNPDLPALAQVMIEMIKLEPIKNIKKEMEILKHPLKPLIQLLLKPASTVKDIVDNMREDEPFSEIQVDQETPIEQIIKKQENQILQDYIQDTLHKLNLNLRLRQYKEMDTIIKKFEKVLKQQITLSNELPHKGFSHYLQIKFPVYILDNENLKLISQLIIIFFMKMSYLLQSRQPFVEEINTIIDSLINVRDEMEYILREISLNLKTDGLSSDDKNLILKRKQSLVGVKLPEQMRQQIIYNLRKHQSYLPIVSQYRRKISRYINQYHTLLTLNDYFQANFSFASQRIGDIIKDQMIIIKNESLPKIIIDPRDLSPSHFNFNQQSPLEKQFNYQHHTQNASGFFLQKYKQESPNYVIQLIFYYYLELLINFDSKSDEYKQNYKAFIENKIDHPVYEFYLLQVKALSRQDIPKEQLEILNNCILGQFIIQAITKWTEQFRQPTDLMLYENKQLYWRHVMCLSYMEVSHKNWCLIQNSLDKLKEDKDQASVMIKIRLLHHLLHMERYYFPIFQLSVEKDFKQVKEIKQNNKIIYLKELHESINISKSSWFYSDTLIQLRTYHLLSKCFAYSPKHYENIILPKNEQINQILEDLEPLNLRDDLMYQVIKKQLILMQDNFHLNIDESHTNVQRYQQLNSYFYQLYKEEGNLLSLFGNIQTYVKAEGFKTSIFVLSLIQFYITIQQYEFADLMIEFCRKLVYHQAPIFPNSHFGFVEDLNYLDLQVSLRSIHEIFPHDSLYTRMEQYLVTPDQFLYLQVLLLNSFFTFQLEASLEALNSFLSTQYDKIQKEIHIFQPLVDIAETIIALLHSLLGNDCADKIRTIKEYKYKEGSLIKMLINHLLCRYYINTFDYEIAYEYSIKVQNYLYSCEVYSAINLKYAKNMDIFTSNMGKQIMLQIHSPKVIELIQEQFDTMYKHLVDEYFIKECILNHLDILTRLPNTQQPHSSVIFYLLNNTKEKRQQIYLLKIISQYFQAYALTDNVDILRDQLQQNMNRNVKRLTKQKQKIKQIHMNKTLLKQVTNQDIINMNHQINLIDYELQINLSSFERLTNKNVLNWSIQAAEKAIQQLEGLCKHYKQETNYELANINLILCKDFQLLNLLQPTQDRLNYAEEVLSKWYQSKRHPIKGYYFYIQGIMRKWIHNAFIQCAEDLNNLQTFTRAEQRFILSKLLQGNSYITKIFDAFRNFEDSKQFNKDLRNFIIKNQETKFLRQNSYIQQATIGQQGSGQALIEQIIDNSAVDFTGNHELLMAYDVFGFFAQNHQYMKSVVERKQTRNNLRIINMNIDNQELNQIELQIHLRGHRETRRKWIIFFFILSLIYLILRYNEFTDVHQYQESKQNITTTTPTKQQTKLSLLNTDEDYIGVWDFVGGTGIGQAQFFNQTNVKLDSMRFIVNLIEGKYYEDNQIQIQYALNGSVLEYTDVNGNQTFYFDSLNATIIDYNVYGKMNQYFQNMTLSIQQINDSLQIYSYPRENQTFNITYELKLEVNDKYQNKALVYSLIVSFLAFIQVVCCIKIYRDILTDERNASQYSLITIVLITTYDTYLSLVHFCFSIQSQYFITPSFLYFILFSLMELKLLTIIWKERFSNVHDNILLRRELYKFYFKFYAAMIIILIMMYKYIFYNSFLLLTCFFMLPQIVHIARKGQQVDFDKVFVFGFLTTRLFIPLYFRGYEGNFNLMRPSLITCFAIITVQTVMIYMYYMQCEYGPRYWVPKFLRPMQHEYFVDSTESEVDCAVCMGSVQKQATETITDIQNRHQLKMIEREQNKIMKTPCNHYFHVICLVRWMAVKMTCPTCRQDLPSAL